MSKRDIAGGSALILCILPDRLWHLGWELGIAVTVVVWLFWPRIRKRILQLLAGRKYVPIAQAAIRVRNRASDSMRVKEALTLPTSDEQTDSIVRTIWSFAPLQLRKSPSTAYRPATFKERDQDHYLSVQGDVVRLFNWLDKGPVSSDVAITRSDLRRAIKKLRAERQSQ